MRGMRCVCQRDVGRDGRPVQRAGSGGCCGPACFEDPQLKGAGCGRPLDKQRVACQTLMGCSALQRQVFHIA